MEDSLLQILTNRVEASIIDEDLKNKLSHGISFFELAIDLIVPVPVFDTANKIKDGLSNYNALRLHKKLMLFLNGISDIPLADREQFMKDLTDIPSIKDKGGETLMDIIDRINNLGKIDILINLFKARVSGNISMEDFLRMSMVLEKISIVDLQALDKYDLETYSNNPGIYEGSLTDALNSSGLLTPSVIGDGGTLFNLNSLGKQILLHGVRKS